MVETNHHLVIELGASERRALRLARDEQSEYRVMLMRSLDQYCSPDARRKGLIRGSDVRQLLAARTITNVPRHMLDLKSMPRHRQRALAAAASSEDRSRGTSPKRLAYHDVSGVSSPDVQGMTPTEGALSPLPMGSLTASSAGPRAWSCPGPASTMWTNRHRFTISLNRQLPLSYDAQCDVRYVTGARRRSSLHLESGFAPLFTKSQSCNLVCDVDQERSPREEQALRFLYVDAEANPRLLVEKRMQEKHRWDRKKGPSKVELNAPKKMPQLLGKTIGKNEIPACVNRTTESMERHREDSEARMQLARERVSVRGSQWHI